MDIGVGDFMECIDPITNEGLPVEFFSVGSLYCVEAILPAEDFEACTSCGADGPGLRFVGEPHLETAQCECSFKPVFRRRDDIQTWIGEPAYEIEDDLLTA